MTGGAAERVARPRFRANGAALVLALFSAASAEAQGPAVLPRLTEGDALGPGWRVVGLPQQKPPLTRYAAQRLDGREVLRVEADRSYGNLAFDWPAGVSMPQWLSWSWRVDEAPKGVDLARKEGDDTPARVCVGFATPLERLPFVERQLLRVGRRMSGLDLPAATLCWAWGTTETPGAVVVNPYTARVRTLVLRGRADALGQWHDERRDVHADFRLAFGDEWDGATPPLAIMALVAADADNTGGRSRAYFAGLRIEAGSAP